MIALFWLQVALEITGAVLSFWRRLGILCVYMTFSALADVTLYGIRNIHPLYGYSAWGAEAVQDAILYALALQLAAKMLEDYRLVTQHIYKALALVASVVTYVFVTTELWEQKFYLAEAVSSLLLLAVVWLGWIKRKRRMEQPWFAIVLGITLSAVGTAVWATLATLWPVPPALYPISAIPALLVWNWSVQPKRKRRLRIAPVPEEDISIITVVDERGRVQLVLPYKKPPSSVGLDHCPVLRSYQA